jgi:predicted negative regulator of RcsB-dependent stress response
METNATETQKPNVFWRFLKKNFLTVFLLLALGGVYLWGSFKMKRITREHETETVKLIEMYNHKMDSVGLANTLISVKAFGWAVRSELMRGNMENIDLLFNNFVKEANIEQIDLVNPATVNVVKSTNKKEEGMAITNPYILGTDKQITQPDSKGYKIINPVMGLDTKIGILIITVSK